MAQTPRRPRSGAASSNEFEAPPAPVAGAEGEFEAPPGDERDVAPEEAEGFTAEGVDADLMQLKAGLEQIVFSRGSESLKTYAAGEALQGADNIVGVGIGPAMRDFESVGRKGPGAPVLNVYVTEPMTMDEAKAVLVDDFGATALSSDSEPVNVIRTGTIDSHAHRHRERPAPCGISVGHVKITAGTLGALARGRSGVRANRLLMLSNNHVLANSNAAVAGDAIVQPGPVDGGIDPRDRVAILEKWVPINFSASAVNYVDCATGWCWPDRVRKEFIYRSGGGFAYFRCGSTPVGAGVGMLVGKTGRTTQLTSGRIIDVSASIRVNFGFGRVANFRDQIAIRGLNGDFSQGGDSGSLIWTWDARRAPVGLLFAGGGGITFGNKIGRVLSALDIALLT
jgi:hypothetical protein